LSQDYTFFPIIRISSIHVNAIRKSIRKNAVPVRCFTLLSLDATLLFDAKVKLEL
jgi:hypothetical protein